MTSPLSLSTCLVTGATGFIGSHLARHLLDCGWKVRVLVRDVSRLSLELITHCDLVRGDLLDSAALKQATEGVDVVFHCAANVATWDTEAAYQASNVHGVDRLLQAMAKPSVRQPLLVHLSSMDVYDFPLWPASESTPLPSGSFGYGRSKAQAESLIRAAESAGLPFVILRPGNVLGPGSQFIARIGDELQAGVMLTIDRGEVNAGVVDVADLVECMLWAAQTASARGATFNIRAPYDVSWHAVLQRLRHDIQGRGLIVNLSFAMADRLARALAALHHRFAPQREPLIHPLIVRLFGRTCGHSALGIHQARRDAPWRSFDDTMARSADWYRQQRRARRSPVTAAQF